MRKWIWTLLSLIWLALLFYPWPQVPPLHKMLFYPTSVFQIDYDLGKDKVSAPKYAGLELHFDQRGVPHIFAETEPGMAFGMGYTHAKDRLFQLEMLRRTVRGRLSEVLGPQALDSDKWWLKFDLVEKSAKAFTVLQEEDAALASVLKAYAEGYNAYIDDLNAPELPPEFHLLDFSPRRMEAYAPILLIRYMDWVLNYSENDLKFSGLASRLPDSLLHYYYPSLSNYAFAIYPEKNASEKKVNWPKAEIKVASDQAFEGAELKIGRDNEKGSNNWAVAAPRSKTGNAFLCNDTHLGLDLPGTWYEVHQVLNGHITHGFSIPGAPFIISGFNEKVAWGMTNCTWDLTEFYQLKTRGTQYLLDSNWLEMESITVSIPVRGSKPVAHTYYETYFGPADTLRGAFLATQWVAQQFASSEMKAFYKLAKAGSAREAYAALQAFGHPPQNFALADLHGEIAMVSAGYALMHQQPSRGIYPGERRTHRAAYRPMGRRLMVANPERGWQQSSNHHQVTDSLAPYLNTIFAPSARGRRISAVLAADSLLERTQLKKLQADVLDGEWPLLAAHCVQFVPDSLRPYLQQWDGRCTEASVAATLYNAYKWRLHRNFSKALLPNFDFDPPAEHLFYLLFKQAPLPAAEGKKIDLEKLAQQTWTEILTELKQSLGPKVEEWYYGAYHQIHFKHLTKIDAFGVAPFAAQGSPRTVNVSSGNPGAHGPSMRTMIEMTPEGPRAETVLAGGQSGLPGHRHYTDQIDDWYSVEYFPINLVRQPQEKEWEQSIIFKP